MLLPQRWASSLSAVPLWPHHFLCFPLSLIIIVSLIGILGPLTCGRHQSKAMPFKISDLFLFSFIFLKQFLWLIFRSTLHHFEVRLLIYYFLYSIK